MADATMSSFDWIGTAYTEIGVWVGCPRQRFLARNARKASDFLHTYYYAYFTQHIKNLDSIRHHSAIKFLHGRVLWNFLKWHFRKF